MPLCQSTGKTVKGIELKYYIVKRQLRIMKIVIDGSKLGLKFSACHLIVGHDKCGRLHGHNYTVALEIDGENTDARGLVVDFIECKAIIREIIEKLDHRVLIAEKSREIVTNKKDKGEGKGEEVELKIRDKRYVFPVADVVFLPIKSLSAEDISTYLGEVLLLEFKKRRYQIESFTVGVDEVAGQGARVHIEV
jgi:6-pyruvoyltetrahydropterin/6-carboxytetrahydropterin synthase